MKLNLSVLAQVHDVGGVDQENAHDGEAAQGVEEMETNVGAHGKDRRAQR
ncbi:hypothetical protein [Actinomyces sp. ZJ308]